MNSTTQQPVNATSTPAGANLARAAQLTANRMGIIHTIDANRHANSTGRNVLVYVWKTSLDLRIRLSSPSLAARRLAAKVPAVGGRRAGSFSRPLNTTFANA